MSKTHRDTTDPTSDIVVGMDDSASARAALTWAASWARRTGARLRVIHVDPPALDGPPTLYPVVPWGVGYAEHERESVTRERAIIQELFDELVPEPSWSLEFDQGSVGARLVRASGTASLLVIGTRQLGPVERLASGSVSQHCVRHADCPVLVVPANRPFRTEDKVGLSHTTA